MLEHERADAEQADAADEPHGGWKDSKVAYLHLKSGSQLIRGVRPTLHRGAAHDEASGSDSSGAVLATLNPYGLARHWRCP